MSPSDDPNADPENKPRWFQVVGSVLSAAIGIKSRKNHARDSKHGKFAVFVMVAMVFIALFILTVYAVVQIVLQ